MKTWKVYGWVEWVAECPPAPNGSRQARHICAATSKKALAILLGGLNGRELVETGNVDEINVAMSKQGTVFWRPLNNYKAEWKT